MDLCSTSDSLYTSLAGGGSIDHSASGFQWFGINRLEPVSRTGIESDLHRLPRPSFPSITREVAKWLAKTCDTSAVPNGSSRALQAGEDHRLVSDNSHSQTPVSWGSSIKAARGWHVDLENAELVVHVELLSDASFYLSGKGAGPGADGYRPDTWRDPGAGGISELRCRIHDRLRRPRRLTSERQLASAADVAERRPVIWVCVRACSTPKAPRPLRDAGS